MHEDAPPHCGCCVRFHCCLVVDMVMSWGYCDIKAKNQPPSPELIQRIKDETEAGNYETIYALGKDEVLFLPSFDIAMECPKYWDYQWGPNPPD